MPAASTKPRLSAFTTSLLLLTSPVIAWAQDADSSAGDAAPTTTPVQRVDILARPAATDLRRAASVAKQIYGREELDQYGDTNVLDVMRRLPGVNIGAGGPRMRGLGSGYTQILINGDPAPPGFALDQLDPAQVERIEVLRAPTADTSAQAVAGTINIILKEAPRRSERHLRVGLADGSDRPMANVNLTLNESRAPLAMSLPLSLFEWQRESRITVAREMDGTDGLPAAARQLGAQESWGYGLNVGPRLNWKLSDDQSLALTSFAQKGWWNNRTDYDNRILQGVPVLDNDTRQNGTWQNLRGNANWNNRFAPDQRIELRTGVQQNRWTFNVRNQLGGVEQLHSVGGGRYEGLTQAGKYSHLLGESHSITTGWDLEAGRRNESRTVTRQGQPLLPDFEGQPYAARVNRQAFYVQDEWEISPRWQTVVGLRHERISTQSRGTDEPVSNTSRVLSPLWHVTWKLDPKGRDLVRASLARTYRAPNMGTLLARPSVNNNYTDTTRSNSELAPDRIGNPRLRPELSTGIDIAFEKYLTGNSLWSVGIFHREISDLIRNVTTLQTVPWATAQRWVSQPQNFSSASTSGLEMEVRGSAAELLPSIAPGARTLNLRASVNVYRSRVAALPGPDNRLDGQQPWTMTLGFDQRITGLPVNVGGSLTVNPDYDTLVTLDQTQRNSSTRTIDLFAQWLVRPGLSVRMSARAGVQPFGPPNGTVETRLANGDVSQIERYTRPQINLSVDMRL